MFIAIHSVLPLVLDRKELNTQFECKLICHVFGVLGNLHGLKHSLLDLIFGQVPWASFLGRRPIGSGKTCMHIPVVDCPNPLPNPSHLGIIFTGKPVIFRICHQAIKGEMNLGWFCGPGFQKVKPMFC